MLPDTAVCGVFGLDRAKDSEVEKMKKFNWNEFKNTGNRIAVHCKTEEEAVDFCKQMHEHGMKWRDGNSYLELTEYEKILMKHAIQESEVLHVVIFMKVKDTKSWNGVITCRKNLQSQI